MKCISSFFLLLVATQASVLAQFRFSPEKPQVGQTVSFTYTPQATPLATDSTLEGRFVYYGAPTAMHLSRPTTAALMRQGNVFVGQVLIPLKGVTGAMLAFRNSKQPQRIDLNKGQLYVIPVYDATGQTVPHAIAGQSSVFTRSHFLYELGSRPDQNRVVSLYAQEFQANPTLYPMYWSDYLASQIKQKKPGYGPKVKLGIETYLASRPALTAAELTAGAQLYENMGDFPKANALRERMKSLDPAGSLVQRDRATAVRNETDWTRKKLAYQAYQKEFPNASYLPPLTVMMTDGYFKNNDIRGLVAFVEQQPVAHTDVLMLNTMAFQLADERRSLPEAEQLIKRAMMIQKTQPKSGNGDDRQRQLMNTYARVLEQQGKYAEAYTAYQDVINPNAIEDSDPRLNERYFLCALQANHAADAQAVTESAIRVGKATPRLKTVFRDWYAKQSGNTVAKADTYLTELEADLRADQTDELRDILINEPAPAFSMTDLQGRTISSASLRGKVIVLDFWATWCGPCIASFPAMKQAQSKFENDSKVQFLFVNTREGGPLQRVHNFMNRQPYGSYGFTVPIDASQRVSRAYKVQGIPTKVVIDPKGRVRYRQIGYSGDPETTVNELTLVVEMLKDEK
ncbi:TlpA family protein disulfide reductase [Spirosoma sp. RP8]|uniref:TlpA family protein disulfide reductase n=1 Tax=Spirosoma liriopis TaxID=2937440 RepID=A0ABT0HP95_9BACT|nr:TlpA disulfide reductase family protein [Spirosoma liriopis]MCK8493979.1 TlpA family protein disulfide reductase [Spirosoma liriopis]